MNEEKQKLPRWKSHKEVEAFKLEDIRFHTKEETLLSGNGHSVIVKATYMAKHEPYRGGYYVRYADGYESFSPAEAFEEGYIKLDNEALGSGRCAAGLSMLADDLLPGRIMAIPPPPQTEFIKWAKELYQLWYQIHGITEVKP